MTKLMSRLAAVAVFSLATMAVASAAEIKVYSTIGVKSAEPVTSTNHSNPRRTLLPAWKSPILTPPAPSASSTTAGLWRFWIARLIHWRLNTKAMEPPISSTS